MRLVDPRPARPVTAGHPARRLLHPVRTWRSRAGAPPLRRGRLEAASLAVVMVAVVAAGTTGTAAADDVAAQDAVRARVVLGPTTQAPVDLGDLHAAHGDAHEDESGTAYPELGPQAPTQGATLTTGAGVTVLGLHWNGVGHAVPALRVREDGGDWSGWEPMATVRDATFDESGSSAASSSEDSGAGEGHSHATEGTLVVGAAEVQVQLAGEADGAVLEAWTTQATGADAQTVSALPAGGTTVVGTRRDWGADESVRGTAPRELLADSPKLGVTVHHTAGSNDYTAEQVPAVLRAIYGYHAQTLGWGDIGYALLVDRFGRAWEGRAGGIEQNIQLAHSTGMNRDWQGISLIGEHDAVEVSPEAMATLASLTAFTLDTHGAQATGELVYRNVSLGWTRTMPVVHGHQDAMATLCPGYRLYSRLPELRQLVAGLQAEGVTVTQRVGGLDRYVVAARLAQDAFLEGTRTAYLASGESLPDALGVGPVADAAGAAVLLTRPDSVPQATLLTLATLGVQEVVLVGREGAVSEVVEQDLAARGLIVRRVGGADRFATAALLATSAGAGSEDPGEGDPGTAGTTYVANGVEVADGLGGSAAAAEVGGTLLLTRPDGVPGATAAALRELDPARVVVLGGEAAVEPQVLDELRTVLPAAVVDRVGGSDRYRTSALVARDAFPTARSAVLASGLAPVDALAGTQLASRHDGPVLLARPTCLPAAVGAVYGALGITVSRLAGGTGVLDWSAGSTTC